MPLAIPSSGKRNGARFYIICKKADATLAQSSVYSLTGTRAPSTGDRYLFLCVHGVFSDSELTLCVKQYYTSRDIPNASRLFYDKDIVVESWAVSVGQDNGMPTQLPEILQHYVDQFHMGKSVCAYDFFRIKHEVEMDIKERQGNRKFPLSIDVRV